MIKVKIYKNNDDEVYGFDIDNHGDKLVCAAVSILALNTVNSIERFTTEKFACDFDDMGGKLHFRMPAAAEGHASHDAQLLVDSMIFGLYGIKEQYGKSLEIIERVLYRKT